MDSETNEPNKVVVEPGELTGSFTNQVRDQIKGEDVAESVFVNRMPANDNDDTVAYGDGERVLHQVNRTEEGEAKGYPDQISIEVGEPGKLVDDPDEVKAAKASEEERVAREQREAGAQAQNQQSEEQTITQQDVQTISAADLKPHADDSNA